MIYIRNTDRLPYVHQVTHSNHTVQSRKKGSWYHAHNVGLTWPFMIQPIYSKSLQSKENGSLTKCFSSRCYLFFLVVFDIFVLLLQWHHKTKMKPLFWTFFPSFYLNYDMPHRLNINLSFFTRTFPSFRNETKCYQTVMSLYKKTRKSQVFFLYSTRHLESRPFARPVVITLTHLGRVASSIAN